MFYENSLAEIIVGNHLSGQCALKCSSHLHYHAEIVYIKEGRPSAVIGEKEYALTPDSLFVVFPNCPHTYISAGEEKYLAAIVSPAALPQPLQLFDSCKPTCPVIERVSSYPDLYNTLMLLGAFDNEQSGDEQNDVIRRGYATSLIGLIFKYLPTEKTDIEVSRAMRSVIDYCVKNYNKELTLGVLSTELQMSKYYISHLFGKEFNMNFNDYINSLRISEACRLLYGTTKSIAEISEEVGFSTVRTFNRAFNKLYKLSPTQYRLSGRRQS